ncbi:MAG: hypothetical protein ABI639_05440 [Thermoanaerobaculia bacterium]
MNESEKGLTTSWGLLKVAIGATAFLAGLDKFFNLLANWEAYLSPTMAGLLPFSATTFMHIVGVIEMAAGILVLSKLTRLGAYVVAAWLVAVALQLLATGAYFDLAVRDVVMAIAAFALAKLTEWRAARLARAA